MDLWYFQENGRTEGPVETRDLQSLSDEGRIVPDTPMWRESMPGWRPASDFFDFVIPETDAHPPPLPPEIPAPKTRPSSTPPPPPPASPHSPTFPPPLPPTVPASQESLPKARSLVVVRNRDLIGFDFASRRGEAGESDLCDLLSRTLPLGGENGFLIARNLMFRDRSGGTTQLDLTLVSQFGVFVIEVKNYSGWIFGSETARQWTECLPSGRFRFQNPLHQNYKHVCVLSDTTGVPMDRIHSLVAFSDACEFKTVLPSNVLRFSDVPAHVLGFRNPCIKPQQIEEILTTFLDWDASVPQESKARHAERLRQTHGKPAPPSKKPVPILCPRCGGVLVIRHSKRTGAPFYGCSRFPRCRFVRFL